MSVPAFGSFRCPHAVSADVFLSNRYASAESGDARSVSIVGRFEHRTWDAMADLRGESKGSGPLPDIDL